MNKDIRVYDKNSAVVFCRTKEKFGGYSNMCAGYPLLVNDVEILTSEALYQACRFPSADFVQRMIIAEKSPMRAKMKSKKYREKYNRDDFDQMKITIMRWCLRVKLLQNWEKFSELLLLSGDLPIVEKSHGDSFWGALLQHDNKLKGRNFLGRLLMELREGVKNNSDAMTSDFTVLPPLQYENFLLYGMLIRPICRR